MNKYKGRCHHHIGRSLFTVVTEEHKSSVGVDFGCVSDSRHQVVEALNTYIFVLRTKTIYLLSLMYRSKEMSIFGTMNGISYEISENSQMKVFCLGYMNVVSYCQV